MYCVIVIDHMNDARPYARAPRRWAGGLGVLFSRLGAPRRRPPWARAAGDDAWWVVSSRVFAAAVDRDRRGRPCKERQAKVLRRSAMTPADVALVEAWREVTYDGGRAAGCGSTRSRGRGL